MKLLYSILSVVLMGTLPALASINPQPSSRHVSWGSLETFNIYSPELERDVTIEVLLPEDYNQANRYPVIYMHDGQNLVDPQSNWNNQAWKMDDAVARLDSIKPIIVGIFSVPQTRVGDLMPTEVIEMINPQVVNAEFAKFGNIEIKGDKYVDFLANTLKSEIDAHYSTLAEPKATSVMGSSMGGLASLYAMSRHPETFGAAACLSTHVIGTFSPNEIFPTALAAYLLAKLPIDGNHKIYFDTGDQTIDASYVPYFNRIMEMITQMGMSDDVFMYKTFPGAAHEEDSWSKRVDIPLEFILAD